MRPVLGLGTGLVVGLGGCEPPECRWELPDPAVLGACAQILGWYADHGECRSVSGCGCTAPDCPEPVPFDREDDCVAACGG